MPPRSLRGCEETGIVPAAEMGTNYLAVHLVPGMILVVSSQFNCHRPGNWQNRRLIASRGAMTTNAPMLQADNRTGPHMGKARLCAVGSSLSNLPQGHGRHAGGGTTAWRLRHGHG
jgi:hypothetical protein